MSRPEINRHTPIIIQPRTRGGPAGRTVDGAGPSRSSGPVLVAIDARVPAAEAILAAITVPARIVRIDPDRVVY